MKRVCWCTLGFFFFASFSFAEPICVRIAADVESVDDPQLGLEGRIQVGDTIFGNYQYDSQTPDSNGLTTVGDYQHDAAPYGISLNAGGFHFRTNPDNVDFLVEIVNDHGSSTTDNYLLRSYNNSRLSNGARVNHISWQLDDSTAQAIASDALPLDPPALADWQSVFGLTLEGETFFVRAHVTEAVLEPGPSCIAPTLEISPSSGVLIETQSMDLVFVVRSLEPLVGGSVAIDGIDWLSGLQKCVVAGTLGEGGRTYRCPGLQLSNLGAGEHTIVASFDLADGRTISSSQTWTVLANTEP